MGRPKKEKISLKKEIQKRKEIDIPNSTDKRPYKADAIPLEKFEELGGSGLFDYQIAAAVGISKDHFPEFKKRRPDVREAIEKGKMDSLIDMRNVVFEIAKNLEYDPNVRLKAAIYHLNSVGGFKEHSDPLIHINMNEAYSDGEKEKEIVTYEDAQDTYLDLIRETHEDGGS